MEDENFYSNEKLNQDLDSSLERIALIAGPLEAHVWQTMKEELAEMFARGISAQTFQHVQIGKIEGGVCHLTVVGKKFNGEYSHGVEHAVMEGDVVCVKRRANVEA